jgi:hypothetical protein
MTPQETAALIGTLRQSQRFLDWKPEPHPPLGSPKPKPEKISFGRGHTFTYEGKTYTNLIVDEKHYSPADLAKAWSFDVETIRNIFRDEPGVLKIGEKNPRGRRMYLTLRIPESVAVRVHKRLSE